MLSIILTIVKVCVLLRYQIQNVISENRLITLKTRQQNCLKRLSRIEGQVRGIAKMIEEGRYCIDILTQMQAIKAALKKVENEVLKDHADHCLMNAVNSRNEEEKFEKLSELVDLFAKYNK